MKPENEKLLKGLVDSDNDLATLTKALRGISETALNTLTGNEGLVSNAAVVTTLMVKDLIVNAGAKLFTLGAWVGGQTLTGLKTGFDKANKQILVSYGTNRMGINHLIKGLNANPVEPHYVIEGSLIGSITTTGSIEDLKGDIKDLTKTLDILGKHSHDVDAYLKKRLAVLKDLASADTNEKAVRILNRLDDAKKPMLKFPHQNAEYSISDVLPGGKVIKFRAVEDENEYSMSGDKPSGTDTDNPYNSEEWRFILHELNKVNDVHQVIVKANESYVGFIKQWSDGVKRLSESLDKHDRLSATLKRDMEKLMVGDKDFLLFYSGFLPRVISYNNSFITNVLSLVTKLI